MNLKKLLLLSSSAILFFGCSSGEGSSANENASSATELQSAGATLFSLPSALQAETPTVEFSDKEILAKAGSLAKVAVVTDSGFAEALEPYRLVPAYIYVAESAKENLKAFIESIASEEWPDTWEGTSESGYEVRTVGGDTTLDDETDIRFRSLTLSKEGQRVLYVSYFKNARNQYSGTFISRSEESDSTWVVIHFNGRNTGVAGERMIVAVKRGGEALENDNAPSAVRVVAVRKGSRIAASVISYHPYFHDEDSTGYSFWGEGPKLFAARTVADTAKNVALLKVAFADTSVRAGTLFTDYLLNDVALTRTTLYMQRLMTQNDTINRLVWWSLDRGKSLKAPESTLEDGLDFLAYTTTQVPTDLTDTNAYDVLQNSKTDILNGTDQDLKKLYWSINLEQPILLRAGARIVGAGPVDSSDNFGLITEDLETDDVELPEAADVLESTEFEFPEE